MNILPGTHTADDCLKWHETGNSPAESPKLVSKWRPRLINQRLLFSFPAVPVLADAPLRLHHNEDCVAALVARKAKRERALGPPCHPGENGLSRRQESNLSARFDSVVSPQNPRSPCTTMAVLGWGLAVRGRARQFPRPKPPHDGLGASLPRRPGPASLVLRVGAGVRLPYIAACEPQAGHRQSWPGSP